MVSQRKKIFFLFIVPVYLLCRLLSINIIIPATPEIPDRLYATTGNLSDSAGAAFSLLALEQKPEKKIARGSFKINIPANHFAPFSILSIFNFTLLTPFINYTYRHMIVSCSRRLSKYQHLSDGEDGTIPPDNLIL